MGKLVKSGTDSRISVGDGGDLTYSVGHNMSIYKIGTGGESS